MLGKKFKSIDFYLKPEDRAYSLLPFNFHRLNDGSYLLVNMVGECLVTDRGSLVKLVDCDPSLENTFYNDLLSKHFIINQDSSIAIDLLALKFRTKQHMTAQFTALHMFVVTLSCDHTCKYCQVSRKIEGDDSFAMSEEIALKSLDLVFQSPSKAIKIEFQGGESLLNFSLIKFIVKEALERNKVENRSLDFVITTNLTYMNQDIIDFCSKHDIYISTSLDGGRVVHNKNRPRPGRDSYELAVSGIKLVQENLGVDKVSALMTTTAESMKDPKAVVDSYVMNNLHNIFLRPISPYGFAIKTKEVEKYNVDKWLSFFKEGLDYIIELNKSGYFIVEQYTAIILRKILTSSNPGYVDLQSPAGTAISAVIYNYDGDVYASDEGRMLAEMGDKKFRLGNVLSDSYVDIFSADVLMDMLEESLTESAPMCSDCAFQTFCGADPVYHYASQGDFVGKKPISFFCKKNKSIFLHIFDLLRDKETKKVIESWVR